MSGKNAITIQNVNTYRSEQSWTKNALAENVLDYIFF